MEAASKVSGFSLGKSRGLWRKFIKKKAKKIEEEIKRDKIEFINGAVTARIKHLISLRISNLLMAMLLPNPMQLLTL